MVLKGLHAYQLASNHCLAKTLGVSNTTFYNVKLSYWFSEIPHFFRLFISYISYFLVYFSRALSVVSGMH